MNVMVTRDTLQSVSTVEDDGDNPAPHDCLRSRSGHPCDHHRLLNIASPWPPAPGTGCWWTVNSYPRVYDD